MVLYLLLDLGSVKGDSTASWRVRRRRTDPWGSADEGRDDWRLPLRGGLRHECE